MRRFSVSWLTFLVFAAAPFSICNAQDSVPIAVGDRVRVTAPTLDIDKYDGTLQALAGDTLTINSLRVALIWVTGLDIHRGTKSNAGKGAAIGLLVGAGIAVAAGIWFSEAFNGSTQGVCETGCISWAVTLALLGAGIGAAIRTDRWEEVPLDQLRVSLGPQRGGRFGVGMSARF